MALPYANGPLHLGHLIGYFQADFWVRFLRMKGEKLVYVCGDDTHGTPIMLKARELKTTPEAIIEAAYRDHTSDFRDFLVDFDHYSSTNSVENRRLAEEFYMAAKAQGHTVVKPRQQLWCDHDQMFLPDRFVKGSCPKCGASDQYGDSCDKCGATYDAVDLKAAACAICGSKPVPRTSETISIRLSNFRDFLRSWVPNHAPKEIFNKLNEWIEGELLDWDISRDAPYFGFEIPDAPGKYFYVWLDAPIGYVSTTQQWAESDRNSSGLSFGQLWRDPEAESAKEGTVGYSVEQKPNVELYHFIGKDIVKFHLLFWPALLKTAGFRLPTQVFVNGFLTVNGEKMSKSKGTMISARTFLKHLPPETLRYYFASKLTAAPQDLDLGLEDFQARVNSDLIGKLTNLGSRGAQMLSKRLNGKMATSLDVSGQLLMQNFHRHLDEFEGHYQNREFARVVSLARELCDAANKYFDDHQPWKLIKEDSELTRQVLTTTLNAFRFLSAVLSPIMPSYGHQVRNLLGENVWNWDHIKKIVLGVEVGTYHHLASRIESAQLQAMVEETLKSQNTGAAMEKSTTPVGTQTTEKAETEKQPHLSIDTFNQVDLRIARIVSAEAVPTADKLLKLTLDVGPLGSRQVFAGIKSAYAPEALQGRLTVVVANLAPRKMKFGVSEGMVLAASGVDETGQPRPGLFILSPDSGAQPGDRVK